MISQFSRFTLVGIVNTFSGLMVIYGVKWLFGLGDVLSNMIGYGVGLIVSFLLNKSWTFRHEGEFLKSALRFITAFAVAYPVNLGVVFFLIEWGGMNSYVSQALGIPPYMVVFFLLSRYVAFRKNPDGGHSGATEEPDRRAIRRAET